MLLVIHNLPLNTRFGEVKSLLLEKCGLRNLILDKLVFEDNAMKITVGLPSEEDAALLVRKINGLYLKGHQLYVQDMRQKPSEQPYRPNPGTRQGDNESHDWNSKPQQSWNANPQQNWNNNPQQSWKANPQQNWNNSSPQNWKNRNNESQKNSNPFLYQQQNQNIQGGYGQDLASAAATWAQQAQQVNAVYDNQSVFYPQNVQYPQQFGQLDSQGSGGWGLGFDQDGGDYANSNTSWGESSVPVQARGRSQERNKFNESRRGRPDRSVELESRDHSRQYSQPRDESYDRPQTGNKRRWEESERCEDDWRQRPASPPHEFRPHHRGRDPQRSGFGDAGPKPWIDEPRFNSPKPNFLGSKPRFEAPKPKFEPRPKFNKKQKFNAPNQKFNVPSQSFNAFNQKFHPQNVRPNAPNQSRFHPKKMTLEILESMPWDSLTEKQQQKLVRTNEYNRSRTVQRIITDIFNNLGLSEDKTDLRRFCTDPVRSRLNIVLGDEKFHRIDMMYAIYLDAYNDEKQMILEEAKQLQRDGVEPKLQHLFTKPGYLERNPGIGPGNTSKEPIPKRFKADGVETGPRPGPSKPVFGKNPAPGPSKPIFGKKPLPGPSKPGFGNKPVPGPSKPASGKIPSYVDGDKQKFKAIKQQHLKDMATLRCPDVSPKIDKIVDQEVDAIANVFHKVIENTPDVNQKMFLRRRANEECIDDFKKMFKQKICQRLTNEGSKIVRIYAFSGKPPKKAELEPFMRQFGVLALKKSDRKPFFTAHLDSYETLDKLCNMGSVKVGNTAINFKPLHMAPKYKKIHRSSLNKLRDEYVASQIKTPEVNILDKDWEIKLAAIKEKEEILKQEKAKQDAAKQEKAVQDAAKKVMDVKAENFNLQSEEDNLKPENDNFKPENNEAKSENDNVELENGNVKSENDNIGDGKFKSENDDVELENGKSEPENPENLNMDIHTDKYGELHSNFDIIDEVQGSDTENDPKNCTFDATNDDEDETQGKSDESILKDWPIGTNPEILFDDDDYDSGGGDEEQECIEQDIDLDDIADSDLIDY